MAGFAEAEALLSPEDLAAQKVRYEMTVVFWLTLSCNMMVLWDMLTRLPREWRSIFLPEVRRLRAGNRLLVAPALLLLIRCLALIYIPSALALQRQPESCQVVLRTTCVSVSIGTGCCLSIFALRAASVGRLSGWRMLKWLLWANVAALSAIWIACALTIDIEQ